MEKSGKRISPSIRFVDQFLAKRSPGGLTGLLLGQLDAFNRITTTFGHDESNDFCARYAEQLRQSFPHSTPVIRLSGRRFAVVFSPDSMAGIIDVAAEITEDNQPGIQIGEDNFLVDVTLGVAVHPTHADDAPSLFRRAELALTGAMSRELAYDIYRPDATRQQATLWKLESDLDRAIQERQLEVYYQPKVDVLAGTIDGVEALVRWRTDSGSFIPPEDFVPLAERSGNICALTWLVFDMVQEAVNSWEYFEEPFSVAINIAPPVLEHPEFLSRLDQLQEVVARQNVSLTLELTEDSLLQGGRELRILAKLRDLGVGLAIDDFGKGYSSLTYLKQLPATELKIDKQFIGTISHDETDRQIVKSVIDLAHALGMNVVAEGVDSAESLAVICELGCEMAQGFYIARPMRRELVRDWVESYSSGNSLNGVLSFKDLAVAET